MMERLSEGVNNLIAETINRRLCRHWFHSFFYKLFRENDFLKIHDIICVGIGMKDSKQDDGAIIILKE